MSDTDYYTALANPALRRDVSGQRAATAAQWAAANPVLDRGEIGIETDTGRLKGGDGSTAWASLSYEGGGAVDGGAP